MAEELIEVLKERANSLHFKCEKNSKISNHYRIENVNLLIKTLRTNDGIDQESLREDILQQVDKYLADALELRNELPSSEANDIQLICICTPSKINCRLLKSIGYEIERDERVCRKLVWQSGEYGDSAEAFIDRTFLARPWANIKPATATALGALTDDFDINSKLINIILNDNYEGEEFVNELLVFLEDNNE